VTFLFTKGQGYLYASTVFSSRSRQPRFIRLLWLRLFVAWFRRRRGLRQRRPDIPQPNYIAIFSKQLSNTGWEAQTIFRAGRSVWLASSNQVCVGAWRFSSVFLVGLAMADGVPALCSAYFERFFRFNNYFWFTSGWRKTSNHLRIFLISVVKIFAMSFDFRFMGTKTFVCWFIQPVT